MSFNQQCNSENLSMEVQCPFQITFQRVKFDEFVDYFFNKFAKYGYNLAMVICSFETTQD